MHKHLLYILTLLLPLLASAAPATPDSLESVLARDGASTELYYNLGNAYSQAGKPGLAVLNYERALRLDPSNSDARNNLAYTENLVLITNETLTEGKNLDPTPADPSFFQSMRLLIGRWSSNTWAGVAVFLFLLTLAGVSMYIFLSDVKLKKWGFFGSGICLILTGVSVWFSFISRSVSLDPAQAVLIANEVTLRAKAAEDAPQVATPLSAGTPLQIVSVADGADGQPWAEVYLNSDYAGWIPEADIQRVRPLKNS